jgi:hypothetical protein
MKDLESTKPTAVTTNPLSVASIRQAKMPSMAMLQMIDTAIVLKKYSLLNAVTSASNHIHNG